MKHHVRGIVVTRVTALRAHASHLRGEHRSLFEEQRLSTLRRRVFAASRHDVGELVNPSVRRRRTEPGCTFQIPIRPSGDFLLRLLVVYCHPHSQSFCRALLDRVLAGLAVHGHDVDLLDLYDRVEELPCRHT